MKTREELELEIQGMIDTVERLLFEPSKMPGSFWWAIGRLQGQLLEQRDRILELEEKLSHVK